MAVEPRTVMAFIGPSGCGKSTYLRTLNRMHEVIPGARVEGTVTMDGVDLYAPEVDPVSVRRQVGMVFQRPNPFPTMSIAENVLAGVRLNNRRMSKSDAAVVLEQSLQAANLWNEVKDRLEKPGSSLWGGQQQRLCIARAIAVKPQVLLMDEPCSALDPISTLAIEDLIAELKSDYTIVIVTHNMQQAARVSDRTAFFNIAGSGQPGRLPAPGDVEEGRPVAHPRRLLHVVRDDDDRVVALQLRDEVLDGKRRDRVQGRARLVHQQHLWLDGNGSGDAQALLLAARQRGAGLLEPVLDLIPQIGGLQRLLEDDDGIGLRHPAVVEPDPGQHVLGDRHGREGVRALEHHADLPTYRDGVDLGRIEVDAVHRDGALDPGTGDDLVHPVEGAQIRRLAAPGRADERHHRAWLDRHRHVRDGAEIAVVDVQVGDVDALSHGCPSRERFGCRFSCGSAPGLRRKVAGDQSGDQIESHHDDDEDEGRGPGPVEVDGRQARDGSVGARHQPLAILAEHVHRQGHHATGEQVRAVSYTHLRAHETDSYLVCR